MVENKQRIIITNLGTYFQQVSPAEVLGHIRSYP